MALMISKIPSATLPKNESGLKARIIRFMAMLFVDALKTND
jgi:hypothetical protein